MTSNNENATPLDELAHLLDSWGADPSRWPPKVRLRMAELVATGPDARRRLAEARALDRLLGHARDAPAANSPTAVQSLADRIVAAAQATTPARQTVERDTIGTAEVIALPRRVPRPSATPLANGWSAAGLMAASLLVGIYLGGSVNLTPVLQELADAAGFSAVVDPSLAAIDDLGDEETL